MIEVVKALALVIIIIIIITNITIIILVATSIIIIIVVIITIIIAVVVIIVFDIETATSPFVEHFNSCVYHNAKNIKYQAGRQGTVQRLDDLNEYDDIGKDSRPREARPKNLVYIYIYIYGADPGAYLFAHTGKVPQI
jgi:glucan phosphoethanolaminetransferase (alkaline phosphatase superfamily)